MMRIMKVRWAVVVALEEFSQVINGGFFFSNTLDTSELRLVAITIAVAWITRKHGTHYTEAAKIGREDAIKKKIRQRAACCWYVEKSFPSNSLWWDKMNSKVAVMIIPAYSAPTTGTLM